MSILRLKSRHRVSPLVQQKGKHLYLTIFVPKPKVLVSHRSHCQREPGARLHLHSRKQRFDRCLPVVDDHPILRAVASLGVLRRLLQGEVERLPGLEIGTKGLWEVLADLMLIALAYQRLQCKEPLRSN